MLGTRYRNQARFIKALLDEDIIRPYTLEARNGKKLTLYSSHPIEEFSPYEICTALFPGGYFCNLTAIYHHGLTNQVPNSVYMCQETIQPSNREGIAPLSESRIRTAFIKPHRHTTYVLSFQEHNIVVVDRERKTDHGVVKIRGSGSPCPTGSRVAGLERALIDAVVAPQYNGGVTSLSAYFHAARKRFDLEKLLKVYSKLNFVYSYAQAIGFLLDHVGMKEQANQLRKVYPPRHRFYIDHNAKSAWDYNERWMLYHPKGFSDDH